MSWTFAEERPIYWEEPPEQIAITNVETGDWDWYMLTSKAMRMIRDAKDDANWLHAELHGAELKAERTCHTIPYNSQAEEYADAWKISAVCSECGWTLETKKGDKVRMHDPYCGGCGAKVVKK